MAYLNQRNLLSDSTRRQFLNRALRLTLYSVPATWLASCNTSAPLPYKSVASHEIQEVPTLRELAHARNIFIGTAVKVPQLQSERLYSQTLSREFDMVTPELVMKFDAIHPARDSYDFRAADTLVNYAAKNAMQVRGHTLAWHQALPAWLTTGTFSQQELQDIFNKHIQTVVTRYRGQIQQWDVVNEAIGDDGQLRDAFWLQKLGPGYIDQAFKLAHDANPQARLFYNDYGGEGRGYKSDQIYAMVQDMLKRNIPIHGVGLQMHVSLKYPPVLQDVIFNMQRLTALGLEVQITEMDVALLDDPRGTDEKFQQQAHIYYNMLSACLSVPNVTAFVMWGFTDRYYWINQGKGLDAPLIFDESYQPKPAYYALRDLLMKSSR